MHSQLLLELARPHRRRRERDAVRVELALVPPGAQPERDPTAGEVVDGGDRFRQHCGVPVAGAVHQAAAPDGRGRHRERGVGGQPLEALVPRLGVGHVGGVEVVPDRDPREPELLDAGPQRPDLVR